MSKIDYKLAFNITYVINVVLIIIVILFFAFWINDSEIQLELTEYPGGLLLGTIIGLGIFFICVILNFYFFTKIKCNNPKPVAVLPAVSPGLSSGLSSGLSQVFGKRRRKRS